MMMTRTMSGMMMDVGGAEAEGSTEGRYGIERRDAPERLIIFHYFTGF